MRALGDLRRKAPLEPAKVEAVVIEQPVQEIPEEASDEGFDESVELV
jgi:hypothetical protein